MPVVTIATPVSAQPADRLMLIGSDARSGEPAPASMSCNGWSISGYCMSEE